MQLWLYNVLGEYPTDAINIYNNSIFNISLAHIGFTQNAAQPRRVSCVRISIIVYLASTSVSSPEYPTNMKINNTATVYVKTYWYWVSSSSFCARAVLETKRMLFVFLWFRRNWFYGDGFRCIRRYCLLLLLLILLRTHYKNINLIFLIILIFVADVIVAAVAIIVRPSAPIKWHSKRRQSTCGCVQSPSIRMKHAWLVADQLEWHTYALQIPWCMPGDCDRFQSTNSNAIRNRLNKGLIDLRFDLDCFSFFFLFRFLLMKQ